MSPTEPGDSSESELDSDAEGAHELMIGDTPNKVSVLKEMFKDIDSEKIACLLSFEWKYSEWLVYAGRSVYEDNSTCLQVSKDAYKNKKSCT